MPIKLILILLFSLALNSNIQAEDKITVGLSLPLSGLAAEYGEAYYNGVKLGLADLPEVKNKIELLIENHQYDSKMTINSVQKLALTPNLDLIYVWGFNPSDAVAPMAEQLKVPVILASFNPVSLGRKNILNVQSSLESMVDPLIPVISNSKINQIALVASQIGALVQGTDYLKRVLPASIKIARNDIFLSDATDFRSLIANLRKENVPAVALFLAPEQVRLFIEQARAQKYEPQYYSGNVMNTDIAMKLFENNPSGPIIADTFIDEKFNQRYQTTYQKSSHIAEAAKGYFLVQFLNFIVNHPDQTKSVREKLFLLTSGTSPAGEYQLVDDPKFGRYVAFKTYLYQIRNGKMVLK